MERRTTSLGEQRYGPRPGRLFIIGCGLLVALAGSAWAIPPSPSVSARAALVMDAETGAVLWEKNGDVPLPPASTTKVLTTVIALESGRLDDAFPVSSYAQSQAPSKLDLRAGQRVRLMDLVYALMLKSANDAAVVVAEGLGGSVDGFSRTMNRRAREMGATRSDFRNPNGLPDPDHMSTARDLAAILRYALSVPGFRGVASTPATEVPIVNASSGVRVASVRSHNRLLTGYPVPVVGKTGYTRAAGRCFVGAATLDGRETIIVVLGSSNLWGDSRRLIAYGLNVLAPEASSRIQFAADPAPRKVRVARKAKSGGAKKKTQVAGKSTQKKVQVAQSGKKSSSTGSAKSAQRSSVRSSGTSTRTKSGRGG